MRMTRLEWRYLQKIALDHPYFDTHKLPLTEKEAKAIVEASNTMTGREFVDSIYAKLSMTRPEEKKDRFAWLHQIGEQFAVPPIRRIAITVLVVVLLTIFFAATPTGRAIAESVIQYFATLSDDGIIKISKRDDESTLISANETNKIDDGDQAERDDIEKCIFVNSFDDFTKATGRTPFVLSFPCTEIYYIDEPEIDYLKLQSTYSTPKGDIVIYQIWNVEDMMSSSLSGFSAYQGSNTIFYSIEQDYTYCVILLDDSILTAVARNSYTIDNLIEMLENH